MVKRDLCPPRTRPLYAQGQLLPPGGLVPGKGTALLPGYLSGVTIMNGSVGADGEGTRPRRVSCERGALAPWGCCVRGGGRRAILRGGVCPWDSSPRDPSPHFTVASPARASVTLASRVNPPLLPSSHLQGQAHWPFPAVSALPVTQQGHCGPSVGGRSRGRSPGCACSLTRGPTGRKAASSRTGPDGMDTACPENWESGPGVGRVWEHCSLAIHLVCLCVQLPIA